MKIVIIASPSDNHTAPLKWALEQAGYTVACWAGVGWSEARQTTLAFNGEAQIKLGPHHVDAGDVVWIRRPNPPVPHPNVSPADKVFADREYRWFSLSALYLLEHLPVRCINPYSASRVINNKAVQLCLAAKAGLSVPATVMTNAPSAVHDICANSGPPKVCKAFFPHIWQKEGSDSLAVTETFEISADALPEDEVLTYAPAIYQEKIAKAFDVRMVLLGSSVYSYSLRTPNAALDWRQEVSQGRATLDEIAAPRDVEKAVLEFSRQAGIEFGSFDFAVDAHGRWWFLEVNEEGQFLWLDTFNPALRIQEKFLAFLTLPQGATRVDIETKQDEFPSWKDYRPSLVNDSAPDEAESPVPILSVEP
jgi:glutathione synthase/RimK-type ligase-like ATP-grasp enzyme